MECEYDKTRSERPSVRVEIAAEIHNAITAGFFHTLKSVACSLDVQKINNLDISNSVMILLIIP